MCSGPGLKGTWLGAWGGELLALSLLGGGMGPFVLHPRALAADPGPPATAEAGPASSSRRSVSGSGPLPCWTEENIRGKKKRRHLLTTFYTGSQGFENSFFFNNCVGSNAYERFLGRITTVVCLQVEEVQRLGGREMGWLRLSVSHPHLLAFNKSLRSISCTARTDEMTEL